MKQFIKELIKRVLRNLPLKNSIIFESHPDLACNTYPVFKLMLDKGLNKKYRMIWLVNDKRKYKNWNVKNVFFININPKNIWGKIRLVYLQSTSKGLIYSNRFIKKRNKKQFAIFLAHGSLGKKLKGIYEINDDCDYMLNQSEFFIPINSEELNIAQEKLICLGYPRNDYLFDEIKTNSIIFNENIKYEKIIIWLPTFRQHKGGKQDTSKNYNYGFPILDSEKSIDRLSKYLKNIGIMLIIKPHPAQDMEYFKSIKLPNIVIIDDELLKQNNIQLYSLLSQSDALITDYSSVYYDYLLTEKPIGLTIDDIEEYEESRGFIFDKPLEIFKGFYIKNIDDFIKFLDSIIKNIDFYKDDRKEIKNLTNFYKDNNSTKRVVEFIMSKIEEI